MIGKAYELPAVIPSLGGSPAAVALRPSCIALPLRPGALPWKAAAKWSSRAATHRAGSGLQRAAGLALPEVLADIPPAAPG